MGKHVEMESYTATQFKRWQRRMNWSVTHTARELRVRERQIYLYRSGVSAVPPVTTRLCKILEAIAKADCDKCQALLGLPPIASPKPTKAPR